tara:strand:+ start:7984 stop:10068 length:2085 start_codon:yes stop_codon:yes gene_type:complete
MKNINSFEKIKIAGMSCVNCAKGIENHLISKGIDNINVNFSDSSVSYKNSCFSRKEIEFMITDIGYEVIKNESKFIKRTLTEKLFWFCLFFTIPLFFTHMFLPLDSIYQSPWIQFTLCVPVYLAGTYYFGKSAIGSIKMKSLNMDVLITIGSTAAFVYSIIGWILELGHDFMFFETSATIITLVLLGNFLETKSVRKTTSSIKELYEIQKSTSKVNRNGNILELSYEDIILGDILLANTGDKIAVDGVIIKGECTIDESMITGESEYVLKKENDNVIGGTIISSGSIEIKVTRVGNETLLSNIISLVNEAQNNKPKIQRLGDKISSFFVPMVIIVSILTFLFSYIIFDISLTDSIIRSIAVLVISCPCAMGLATPTAIIVGIGRAARRGILIKGGDTIEKLHKSKNIFFDKTGTISTGKFKVKELKIYSGDENVIKNIIFNLEKHSSHPISKSLLKEFNDYSKELELTNIKEVKGIGISALYENDLYNFGSFRILNDEINNTVFDLYLLKNDKLIAAINIKDEVKNNIQELINRINKFKRTFLISGDKEKKCKEFESLAFDKIYFEKLPNEKLEIISKYEDTVMVGDGINDAPALSQADIGVSISGASSIALHSSDVILLNNKNLDQLIESFKISKHTYSTIKQNLFWAFSYNIFAIPLAIFGQITPMYAALFMAFSDIIVIGNSLRLKYKKLN